ncbi:hypothetical protein ALC60_13901 [Trachymyrmex zeteki]|uniref:Uncharacterized protein n=1 Tax=Mycetomoellerius zeteki TaxID=64791 RepID=A0A151WH75_9HYME|nr:hypothetical protein ALC60_13901 [Trachymyrmex zeteki]
MQTYTHSRHKRASPYNLAVGLSGMLRSERNGDCWNNLTSLDMYISANSLSIRKRQLGVIMKRFRRVTVYAQKFTLVLSRQICPSRAFSFRYISGKVSHKSLMRRFYAGNDPRRDAIMRINHSDKRQPLLPILLPQSCPDFGRQLINQIIIIVIFVSPQQFSQSCFLRANLERFVQLRSKVAPRCRNKMQCDCSYNRFSPRNSRKNVLAWSVDRCGSCKSQDFVVASESMMNIDFFCYQKDIL